MKFSELKDGDVYQIKNTVYTFGRHYDIFSPDQEVYYIGKRYLDINESPIIPRVNVLFETKDMIIDLRNVVSIKKGFGSSKNDFKIEYNIGNEGCFQWLDLKYWDSFKTAWDKVANQ